MKLISDLATIKIRLSHNKTKTNINEDYIVACGEDKFLTCHLASFRGESHENQSDSQLVFFSPRHWNTGLVSSRASLTLWGEGTSLALVGDPSSDGVTIKMPYRLDVLHLPASHPIFSSWVG